MVFSATHHLPGARVSNSARPVLIYRLGSLGDTLVALPCFHLVRRLYPERRIVLLTNHPVAGLAAPAMDVLAGSGLCDEAIPYPLRLRDLRALASLRRQIRSYRFDIAFDLTESRGLLKGWRDHLFLRLCGIRRIIGTTAAWGDYFIHRPEGPLEEQECERLARRLRTIGRVDVSDRAAWDLHLKPDERDRAATLLREGGISAPFIAASVGSKLPVKDWGNENWSRLFHLISSANPALGLVLAGSAEDFDRSAQLRRSWHGRAANLCGRCGPRVSAAVFERAALFVGHDSGPMHLAAATGIAVVAVFSWHNPPGQWFPGCLHWDHLMVFYPPLPEGMWSARLSTRRGPCEGVLLIRPEAVAEACLRLTPAMAAVRLPHSNELSRWH
ncbi:MAG TPA: glycosyltransferase family 9 protein [Dongiaceae bacterium]|nr:glycosyltransferase family 9 protein [Dongiaceae bacterium]